MNRRQRMQPREADGRDLRRNREVSVGLHEMGFVLVRQQAASGVQPVGYDLFPGAHPRSPAR
jgi:hypothetical protein